jgi:hypothetical protein
MLALGYAIGSTRRKGYSQIGNARSSLFPLQSNLEERGIPDPQQHHQSPNTTPKTLNMPSQTLLSVFEPRKGYNLHAPAVILPAPSASSSHISFSYQKLHSLVQDLQRQLASFGLQPGEVVSSSLINGIEFTLAFLATGAERWVFLFPLNSLIRFAY